MNPNDKSTKPAASTMKPWYKKWWGIILAILIWPLFLIWYAWAKSSWGKGLKIGATALGFLGAMVSVAMASSSPTTPTNTKTVTQATTPSVPTTQAAPASQASPTAQATKQPTPAPTPKPTPAPTVPAEYKSALSQADSYANTMHLSKQGVYDQLTSQYGGKFSAAAAQYAIDNVSADWNANALVSAKNYQSQQSLSPSAIHDQLTSAYGDKFTQAEADYAIQHLND